MVFVIICFYVFLFVFICFYLCLFVFICFYVFFVFVVCTGIFTPVVLVKLDACPLLCKLYNPTLQSDLAIRLCNPNLQSYFAIRSCNPTLQSDLQILNFQEINSIQIWLEILIMVSESYFPNSQLRTRIEISPV